MKLDTLSTLLLDGDGVLWHGNQPAPGLAHFFDVLRARGIAWALLTNNSTNDVTEYIAKFNGFGIDALPGQMFSSGTVTVAYVSGHFPHGSELYVIGESGLKGSLASAGFAVCDGDRPPQNAAAVVTGLDRQITYARLEIAMQLIRAGVPWIATNPDPTIPTPDGLAPGAGSIIAALETASGAQPLMIGKPQPHIYHAAIQGMYADPAATAVVGDRLDTDILGAKRAGIAAILVMGGVTTDAILESSDIVPDAVFGGIDVLADALNHV